MYLNMEECRATWREEAKSRAVKEADERGLEATERDKFISKRELEICAELEKIGTENL
jgi:hypothetical protein